MRGEVWETGETAPAPAPHPEKITTALGTDLWRVQARRRTSADPIARLLGMRDQTSARDAVAYHESEAEARNSVLEALAHAPDVELVAIHRLVDGAWLHYDAFFALVPANPTGHHCPWCGSDGNNGGGR